MQNNSKKIKNKGFTPTPKNFGVSSRSERGFTLIEALIAITILTVSIMGPITIATKSISSAIFARDQITAFYLAQEAVEFIRNRRDGDSIQGTGNWLSGNLTLCRNGKVCTIDIPYDDIKQCIGGSGECGLLRYNSTTGFYNYKDTSSSNKDSIFTREIQLTKINNQEEEIKVTLSWKTGINQKTFVVKEHIFDW